jgi:hypothetical protein
MPLSRHFYSLDEVQAALYYTTSRNNTKESLFWCQELILSQSISEIISTLFESWLWHKGPFYLQWLIHASKSLSSQELSPDDILLSTFQLTSTSITDHSLINILTLTIQHPNKIPDRVTPKTPSILPSSDKKEIYFIRALFQGKASCAWWISQYIPIPRIWELLYWYIEHICPDYSSSYHICFQALQNYEQLLGYRSDKYDIIVRCQAILSLSLSDKQRQHSFQPLPFTISPLYNQFLESLQPLIGYKSFRIYTIPIMCLYGTTQRGCSKWTKNSTYQLHDIETYLIGCSFWDETISVYGEIIDNKIVWKSDNTMEEFYNQYFPDDIPDEWNKSEKNKSHGDGILGPKDSIKLAKYIQNYLSKMSRLYWNTNSKVIQFLKDKTELKCQLTSLFEISIELSEINEKLLEPVHKKLII